MTKELDVKTQDEAIFISEMCTSMVEQFRKKNVAYNDNFSKQFEKYGSISALIRMSDKFSRIESTMTGLRMTMRVGNSDLDERLEKLLVDMACYCLMTLYELENA